MDKLPGFKNITAKVKITSSADKRTIEELNKHVLSTSPVGMTLARPVALRAELEAISNARSAAAS